MAGEPLGWMASLLMQRERGGGRINGDPSFALFGKIPLSRLLVESSAEIRVSNAGHVGTWLIKVERKQCTVGRSDGEDYLSYNWSVEIVTMREERIWITTNHL